MGQTEQEKLESVNIKTGQQKLFILKEYKNKYQNRAFETHYIIPNDNM